MTHSSKRKGNTFERELVKEARAAGLDAKRAWGSNGKAMGLAEEVDLLIGELRCQAKRRAKLPTWVGMTDEVDAVCLREDRGGVFVLLRYAAFLRMLSYENSKQS